eukprot:CAMPEP_0172508742 /NCGR_PEP_ID=MMETSP1066-20121228/214410_1 /TAXON_ID=671091 /ORGANISM="Coscinodiscus wailesii, Strain CCMP2513" /LENGTH=731 /DNA_ID=CAMNT_0013286865 /DNA_START=136 /DNA_END=2331 /DNA_ORIENTATION=+
MSSNGNNHHQQQQRQQEQYQQSRHNPDSVSFEPIDVFSPNSYDFIDDNAQRRRSVDSESLSSTEQRRRSQSSNCSRVDLTSERTIMLQDIVNDPARVNDDLSAIWNEYTDSLHDTYSQAEYTPMASRRRRNVASYICVAFFVAMVVPCVAYVVFFWNNNDGGGGWRRSGVPDDSIVAVASTTTSAAKAAIGRLEERCGGGVSEASSWEGLEEAGDAASLAARWRSCARTCLAVFRSHGCASSGGLEVCRAVSERCGPIFDVVTGGSQSSSFDGDSRKSRYVVPPLPSDISLVCHGFGGGSDSDEGGLRSAVSQFMNCEGACSPARCCVSPRPDDNCFLSNVERCREYAPYCTTLESSSPTDAERACRADYLRDGDRWGDCFAACTTAACCFPTIFTGEEDDDDERPNCVEETEWCDTYNVCRVLSGMNEERDDETELVKQACAVEKINEGVQSWKMCFDLCISRECCHADDNKGRCGVQGPTKDYCQGYDTCDIMFDVNYNHDTSNQVTLTKPLSNNETTDDINNINNGTTTTNDPPLPPSNATDEQIITSLNVHCAPSQIATTQGYAACGNICIQRRCCFDAGPLNCHSSRKDWCEEFHLCKNLDTHRPQRHNDLPPVANLANTAVDASSPSNDRQRDDDKDEEDMTLVERLCAPDELSLTSDRKKCQNTCQKRKCCWDTNERFRCDQAQKEWCQEFASCLNLNAVATLDLQQPQTVGKDGGVSALSGPP